MDRRHILALGAGALTASAARAAALPPPRYLPRSVPPPPKGLAPGMTVTAFRPTGRAWRIRLALGDEMMSGMTDFGAAHEIKVAFLTGVGGFRSAELAWFDPAVEGFKPISVREKCEIASLDGVMTRDVAGRTTFHAHVVLSLSDGTTRSGHLISGVIDPSADIIVTDLGGGRPETPR